MNSWVSIAAEAVEQNTRPVISDQLVHIDLADERLQDVLGRVREAILGVYPEAEFTSYIGTNPLGVYVEAYTDGGDLSGILHALDSKMGNLQVAAGVPVCILPRTKAVVKAA